MSVGDAGAYDSTVLSSTRVHSRAEHLGQKDEGAYAGQSGGRVARDQRGNSRDRRVGQPVTAGKLRRIDAERLQAGAWVATEERVSGRRLSFGERRERDDAAGLIGARATREVLEVTANQLALRHADRAAHQDGRHHVIANRGLRIDLLLHQCDEKTRALRMADEDDTAPLVVLRHVRLPHVDDVAVGDRARVRVPDAARQAGRQTRQRDLTVSRRKDAADPRIAPRPERSPWLARSCRVVGRC